MRKVDVLCNEKFNGNMPDTLNYIVRNIKGEELKEYLSELNTNESVYASNVLYDMAVEKNGEKRVIEVIRQESSIAELNLTKEEVQKAQKNPYKAKLGKSLLKLLIINGGVIALTLLMNNFHIGAAQSTIETLAIGGATIYSSLTAMDIGVDLLKYFKFKKLKNQYNKENEEKENMDDFEKKGGKIL